MHKRKKSKLGLLIVAAALVYFLYVIIDQQKLLYAKQNEMGSITSKIEEEKKLNGQLQEQRDNINGDEYIEKIAREKL